MSIRKRTNEQTMVYKTLHRKLKMDQHKRNKNPGVNSGGLEGLAVLAPPLAPFILIFSNI
jgi:hypothetical protein